MKVSESDSAMKPHQRDHLLSVYRTLKRLVEEIEDVAVRGRSPSGSGPALPPLPPSEWTALQEDLQRLLGQVRALVADLAPEELQEFEQPQSLDRARSWIAILLGRIGELFDDLEPRNIARRFGEIPPEEAAIMEEWLDRIEDTWQKAVEALDSQKRPQTPSGTLSS